MIKRVITMKKSIQKTGKVLLATSIALTTLSVGSIGFSHDNQAHAKGHENPTNPKSPKNSQIKKVKAHYSKKQVKKINDKLSTPSGGLSEAFKYFSDVTMSLVAAELGPSKAVVDIGSAQWKKTYASHFKAAAKKGTGLTITYKVDVKNRTLEGVSFSS